MTCVWTSAVDEVVSPWAVTTRSRALISLLFTIRHQVWQNIPDQGGCFLLIVKSPQRPIFLARDASTEQTLSQGSLEKERSSSHCFAYVKISLRWCFTFRTRCLGPFHHEQFPLVHLTLKSNWSYRCVHNQGWTTISLACWNTTLKPGFRSCWDSSFLKKVNVLCLDLKCFAHKIQLFDPFTSLRWDSFFSRCSAPPPWLTANINILNRDGVKSTTVDLYFCVRTQAKQRLNVQQLLPVRLTFFSLWWRDRCDCPRTVTHHHYMLRTHTRLRTHTHVTMFSPVCVCLARSQGLQLTCDQMKQHSATLSRLTSFWKPPGWWSHKKR